MQDIVVGHDQFDKDFIIKGTDENLVRKLFASEKLRELITKQRAVRLSIHKEPLLKQYGAVPAGVHILAFEEDVAINSFERLVSILS